MKGHRFLRLFPRSSYSSDGKERGDRRLRVLKIAVAFLSSTVPGAVREPDTESDEEDESHKAQKLRRATKAKSGTSTPTIAGMRI
ncbi:hypothetical protein JCM8547_008868 [Rhodosporidiobolus lusitaniae]